MQWWQCSKHLSVYKEKTLFFEIIKKMRHTRHRIRREMTRHEVRDQPQQQRQMIVMQRAVHHRRFALSFETLRLLYLSLQTFSFLYERCFFFLKKKKIYFV